MNQVARFQIGKAGISPGVITTLATLLQTHKFIRISALKNSGRDRDSIKAMAEQLIAQLPWPCSYKVIGFTIVLRKHPTGKK